MLSIEVCLRESDFFFTMNVFFTIQKHLLFIFLKLVIELHELLALYINILDKLIYMKIKKNHSVDN